MTIYKAFLLAYAEEVQLSFFLSFSHFSDIFNVLLQLLFSRIHCSVFVPAEIVDRGFTVLCSQQPITSPYPVPEETYLLPLTTRLIGGLG